MNVPELFEQYETFTRDIRKRKPKTVTEYMRVLRKLSAEKDLLALKDPIELDELIVEMGKRENWCDRYQFKLARICLPFYRWLAEKKITTENLYPKSNITKPKAARPPFLLEEDYQRLVTDPTIQQQDLALCTLLWETAVRREECSLIEQSDFTQNSDGSINLHIRPEVSKGGYGERDLTIPPHAAFIIRRQFQCVKAITPKPAIFLNRAGRAMDPDEITARIKVIGDRSTLTHGPLVITPKMFRHGRGVVWILNDVPETVVMRWLGHISLEMTAHYVALAASISNKLHRKYLPQEYAIA